MRSSTDDEDDDPLEAPSSPSTNGKIKLGANIPTKPQHRDTAPPSPSRSRRSRSLPLESLPPASVSNQQPYPRGPLPDSRSIASRSKNITVKNIKSTAGASKQQAYNSQHAHQQHQQHHHTPRQQIQHIDAALSNSTGDDGQRIPVRSAARTTSASSHSTPTTLKHVVAADSSAAATNSNTNTPTMPLPIHPNPRYYPDSATSADSSIRTSASLQSVPRRGSRSRSRSRSRSNSSSTVPISSLPLAPDLDLTRTVSGSAPDDGSINSQIGGGTTSTGGGGGGDHDTSIRYATVRKKGLQNHNKPPSSRTSVTSSATMDTTTPTSLTSTISHSPGVSGRSRSSVRDHSRSPSRSQVLSKSSSHSGHRSVQSSSHSRSSMGGQSQQSQSKSKSQQHLPKPLRRRLKNQDPPKSNIDSAIPLVSSMSSMQSIESTLSTSELHPQGYNDGDDDNYNQDSMPKSSMSLGDHLSERVPAEDAVSDRSGVSNRSGPVYGSARIIPKEEFHKTERWVFLLAFFLCLLSSVGLSFIILWVFGASGNQLGKKDENIQSKVEYLSEDPAVFDNPNSPQSLALQWLTEQDESKVDLYKNVKRRENRYSLAVLYYATTEGSSSWKDDLNFLSPKHECQWFQEDDGQGIFCDAESNVIDVNIQSNKLRGYIPVEISALSSLRTLDLSDNRLSGTIPTLRFGFLDSLILQRNRIEGSIPDYLADLSSLRLLDLSSNELTSTISTSLGLLVNLQVLRLGYNSINGTFSEELAFLSNTLQDLNVTSNALVGSMDFMKNYPRLELLDVSSNTFMGTLPFVMGGLTNLASLDFSNNQVQGSLPSTLGLLRKLQHLAGSNNALSGTFPWSFFDNDNTLLEISLSDNVLSGSLPSDIVRFDSLELVDIGRNKLSGDLPNGIGGMTNLKELRLPLNRLTGKLPAELGLFESIEILDLAGNSLSSTIPPALGSMATLKHLSLNTNNLFGDVPLELGKLDGIEKISLHNNELSGDLEFLCAIDSMPMISADCGGDPPQISCSCCTVCVQR